MTGSPHPPEYRYHHGPDSEPHEGVPTGVVMRYHWLSDIFPGTERDYWVYVPAQYEASRPACLMVFQDGVSYVSADGEMRVPIVFDNLIHRGEMPVTIGLFVNPGAYPGQPVPTYLPEQPRQIEYDTLSERYARLLLDELIPELRKSYALTEDPAGWAICGCSSGAIAAWTVAWEHPERFRKVLSHVGSFADIRGGNAYPSLIRKTPAKPIRIYLQAGENDLDWEFGHWLLANQEMAAALAFAGYDYKLVVGKGGHSHNHGGAILPDSLRWLWQGYTPAEQAPVHR